ncbi:putative polysaccharide biosynthesis protein [Pseudalkalibacillus hwajinpoensis]|uniref:Polysaccharide biosynthesis protein n=1 Tax=Guptibacillus hwajinpoensis TaxID=208199 RepID=A0A4V5PY00_9BACL|nr:polysaccharide biosynthesis protein [Pseudalkalibacillus hwajinpoensis]TKD67998.1 polysaccharide biosynthesis protein [Pseudalkalibacillus hwajinpoensis]
MSDSNVIRGTMLLTAATLFSRVLGMIYMFPFTALVGTQGVALYTYAYTPYTIMLSLSTVGIPLAVSKFVSKYHTLGDYRTGRRLYKSGLVLMALTGFVAFLVLFLLAEPIARIVIDEGKEGNSIADVTLVIRVVSMALLIVPIMSLTRGFFQGLQSMGPTAVSQVVEQVFRIVFILASSVIIIKFLDGDAATAATYATFGAFVGAVGGLMVVFWYYRKRKPELDRHLAESTVDHNVSLKDMYKEIITYALPFVVVGLAIPLYLQVDTFLINPALKSIGYDKPSYEEVFAIITGLAHKLIMIPVSLATALAMTIIPAITKSFTANREGVLQKQLTQTFQILLFLTLPAAIGLAVLSEPVFRVLYPTVNQEVGSSLLMWYAPTAILFALFSVTAAILQGINKQKFAVYSLLAGLVLKAGLTYPLVTIFEGKGAILATNIGLFTSVVITIIIIKRYTDYEFGFIFRRLLLIGIFVAVMAVASRAAILPLESVYPDLYLSKSEGGSMLYSSINLLVGITVGGIVYLWLSYRSNLAGLILGERFTFLKRR